MKQMYFKTTKIIAIVSLNQELHLELPRVADAVTDNKHFRRTKNQMQAQPNQTPFPLVQIAEKYHKEFQEYQKQNHALPQAAPECLALRATPDRADVRHFEDTSGALGRTVDELQTVADANNVEEQKGNVSVVKEEAELCRKEKGSGCHFCWRKHGRKKVVRSSPATIKP